MKLAKVSLARTMSIGRNHKAELSPDLDGELTGDMDSRTVRVGNQIIPFEAVNSMTAAEPGETCPECSKNFVDARALGAHRRHLHGVKGGGGEAA